MTNEEAIDVLHNAAWIGTDADREHIEEAVEMAIKALTAQPEKMQLSEEDATSDCISRQAAIDAILAVTGNSSVRELYEHVQENGLSDMWSGGVNAAIDIIIAVPPVQPEPCEDTISRKAAIDAMSEAYEKDEFWEDYEKRLNELPSAQEDSKELSFTHKALDCISRQAAIEALKEAFNPSITNFVKAKIAIDKLPSAQPEPSDAVYRLYKRAYEAGQRNAQPEIIRCKECANADENYHCDYMTTWNYGDCFCSYGKRRTDG